MNMKNLVIFIVTAFIACIIVNNNLLNYVIVNPFISDNDSVSCTYHCVYGHDNELYVQSFKVRYCSRCDTYDTTKVQYKFNYWISNAPENTHDFSFTVYNSHEYNGECKYCSINKKLRHEHPFKYFVYNTMSKDNYMHVKVEYNK